MRRPPGQRGVAMLIVLWMLTVVAILAAGFAKTTRTETQVVINVVEQSKARALLDSGVELAALALLDPDEERRWRADGSLYEVPYDGGMIRVRIVDEKGKIDLNVATDELLKGLLLSLELEPEQVDALGDAILDWRDSDDLRLLHGAEDSDYRSAGLDYGAGDAPFVSIAQLYLVLGMTPEIYDRLAPYVTVYSLEEGVNPMTAPSGVLRALPGILGEDIEAVLELRSEDPYTNREQIANILAPAAGLLDSSQGPIYGVAVTSETAAGIRASAEVVIWLAADEVRPYRVLEWRDLIPAAVDSAEGTEDIVNG